MPHIGVCINNDALFGKKYTLSLHSVRISFVSSKIRILVIQHTKDSATYLKICNFGPQDFCARHKYRAEIWQREGENTLKKRDKDKMQKSHSNMWFLGAQNWGKIPNFISSYFFGGTFAQKFELWHLVTNLPLFWKISEIMGRR